MKRVRMLFRLYGTLMRQFLPIILLQATIYAVIGIFFIVVQPILIQIVFSGLEAGQIRETFRACLQYGSLLLLVFTLTYVNNVFLDTSCFKAIHYTICNIFEKWHRRRGDFADEGTVFQDVTAGAQSMVIAVGAILQLSGSVGALLFLIVFSSTAFRVLPIILSIMSLLLIYLNFCEFTMISRREKREQEMLGEAEEQAQRLFAEMNFLQDHKRFDNAQKEYRQGCQRAWNARLHKENGHTTIELLSDTLMGISFAALFLSVVFDLNEETVTMADMAVTISLLQSIARSVAELLIRIKGVTAVLVPVERVADLLQNRTIHKAVESNKEGIIIDAKSPIIIKEGEHVAIIGHNGSGKTTLLNKIAGISYQIQGAAVTVYGNDAEKISYENRRQCISIAPKEEMLFHVSARENVLMNAEENENSRISALTDLMEASDFLDLQTFQLSGGQAKRVNLMRACIHSARIVLADEPTASLDVENAERAMKMLHYCTEGKILIVVTHDPESLPDFDKIIFMDQLKPAFSGSYKEFRQTPEFKKWIAGHNLINN